MTTKDSVISIFNRFEIKSNEQIDYINNGQKKGITVDRFAYIIEQADEYGLVHLPILESFETREELISYSGHLLSQINQSIINETFTPILGESIDVYGFVVEKDVYDNNGED